MPQPSCTPAPSRRRYSKMRPRCSMEIGLPELCTDSSMRSCAASILMRMPEPSPYLTALVIRFSIALRSEFSHHQPTTETPDTTHFSSVSIAFVAHRSGQFEHVEAGQGQRQLLPAMETEGFQQFLYHLRQSFAIVEDFFGEFRGPLRSA